MKDLYILTGFLGSGKTSLLLHLLNNTQSKKIGVIQNEFGKTGVDGEIIRAGDIEMIELNRGSIFCSCLRKTFTDALGEMGEKELDCVIVESSGLADPSNMDDILLALESLQGKQYQLKGILCLVDGVNFESQLEDIETVNRQLAHCHMAVINKTDLISPEELKGLEKLIHEKNPICLVTSCERGQIEISLLEQDLTDYQWLESEDTTNSPDNKPKSISMECADPVDREKLVTFLQKVMPDCYRMKGFFLLKDGWYQVDTVERLLEIKPCEAKEISQLVFLSKIGPQVIRTVDGAWKEIMDVPMKLKN